MKAIGKTAELLNIAARAASTSPNVISPICFQHRLVIFCPKNGRVTNGDGSIHQPSKLPRVVVNSQGHVRGYSQMKGITMQEASEREEGLQRGAEINP